MPRRRRTAPRLWLLLVLIVLVLPAAAALAVWAFVDPNDLKPRIAEAVQNATGRVLSIDGRIGLGVALAPTLRASGVHLSNPPGFSRPDMASLGEVKVQLSLWPLLRGRLEITQLELSEPDIGLEINKAGEANWRFARPLPPASVAPSNAARPNANADTAPRFAIASIRVTGGKLTWRDDRSDRIEEITIRQLQATEAGWSAPISASADMRLRGHDVALNAETDGLERLLTRSGVGSAWKLQLVARSEGMRLAASGTAERPADATGYDLSLEASTPDLTTLDGLTGQKLPPLHDVSASARLSDATGEALLSALKLHAGPSDLNAVLAGLALDRLDLDADGQTQPVHAEAEGRLGATAWKGNAAFGSPASLLEGRAAGLPIAVAVAAAGAQVSAKGNLTSPATLSGLDLAITATVADLSALSGLAGEPLPPLRDLSLTAQLSDRDGGLAHGAALHAVTLKAPFGDLAGDLDLGFQKPPSVQGQLTGKRFDLDAVLLAPQTSTPPPPTTSPPAPAASPPPPASGPRHLISDRPFNLAFLSRLDGDLRLAVEELRAGGVAARDLAGHIVLNHGRLTLDPVTATLPGGRLDLHASVDATAAEPVFAVALNAPGVAVKPLLTAFGLPDDSTGNLELALDLTATGRTPHAIAATLSGKIGALMTEGELDNRLLANMIGAVLHAARLPGDLVPAAGRTKLRCIATRMDAAQGIATVTNLVLDTSRALVQGGGVVNLADETLGLRLRPLLRVGGPGVVLPVRVAGAMAAPNVALDAGGALAAFAGGAAAAAERGGDACGPAIAAARAARPAAR